LRILPASIGQLANLESLDLINNRLTALPKSLGQLKALKLPELRGNPLNSALQSAYNNGLHALRTYLNDLK
jgi:Leucine-rich repeat (LRR) protein